MPEDMDGYIIDERGHFYAAEQSTADLLTELQRHYADVGAMNAAISAEWKATGYDCLRMGAAYRLLQRVRLNTQAERESA